MRDVDVGLSSWSCLEETVICETEDSTMEVGVELRVQLDHSVIGLWKPCIVVFPSQTAACVLYECLQPAPVIPANQSSQVLRLTHRFATALDLSSCNAFTF